MVADALEVSRVAGVIAAHSWLEGGGREDIVRGLPALPSPTACLAAVDAGGRLVHPDPLRCQPLGSARATTRRPGSGRLRSGPDCVLWHAGSSIPLPPSSAPGAGPVTWAFLPRPALQLAPPVTVLHLLGRTAAMARHRGSLALPGGTLVTPAVGVGD